MTKIEFRTNIEDTVHYACMWAKKAWQVAPGSQIVFFLPDDESVDRLNTELWQQTETEFLAHAKAGTLEQSYSTILLTKDDSVDVSHYGILVNLTNKTPRYFAQFERLIELISTNENDIEEGRKRYKAYKERGYEISHVGIQS